MLAALRSFARLLAREREAGSGEGKRAPPGLRRRLLGAVRSEGRPRRGKRLLAWGLLLACAAAGGGYLIARGTSTPARPPTTRSSRRGGSPRATLRTFAGSTVLAVAGLPRPSRVEAYEVWVAEAGGRLKPTKVFLRLTAGAGSVSLPADIRGEVVVAAALPGGRSPSGPVLLRLHVPP